MKQRVQCANCGYLTYPSESACPRCKASLLHARPIGSDPGSGGTVYGSPGAPGGPSAWPEPGRGTYAAPKARGGGGSRAMIVAAVLIVVIAALGIVAYRTTIFVAKTVEDVELRRMLENQPDFKADCEGVEGKLEYKGSIAQRGSAYVLDAMFPRAQLLKDSRF